jgi:glycosyltransferase involved in cell wall biosynthesis
MKKNTHLKSINYSESTSLNGIKKTFGFYYEEARDSSGARFFRDLCCNLEPYSTPYSQRPAVVLFNMSAPIQKIVLARIRGQKIVLRVDGYWFDRISPDFLKTIPGLIRIVIGPLAKIKKFQNTLADLSNFLFDNYKSFIKIALANQVVYQSNFSKVAHSRYFKRKPNCVILNASNFKANSLVASYRPVDCIRLCIIYSDAPSKGIYESIMYVRWLNEKNNIKSEIHLFGYSGLLPPNAPKDMRDLVENNPQVVVYPKFKEFDGPLSVAISQCHLYLCLSRRDSCPNAVIESMSFGLPVIGLRSGGLTDIVGEAGILIDFDDWASGFFHPQRYEFEIAQINYYELMLAMIKILTNLSEFKRSVKQRFEDDLEINVATLRYKRFLEKICVYE